MGNLDRLNVVAAGVLGLLALVASGAAVAATDSGVTAPAPTDLGLSASLGSRSDLVRSRGLDPFSAHDQIQESAVAVSYAFGGTVARRLAIGLEWDHGSTAATAREAPTSLKLDRLSLTLEGRLPLSKRVGLFGRVAPGLLHDNVTIHDASAAAGAFSSPPVFLSQTPPLHQSTWVAAADVSAGLSLEIYAAPRPAMAGLVFSLTAEGGYGYAQSHGLVLRSGAEVQPGRTDAPLALGDLALRGAFIRIGAVLSF